MADQQRPKIGMKRKRKSRDCVHDIELAILSKLQAEEECDAEEHFGLHVASILRSLPPRQRAFTKVEIDRLLFSAQFPEMRVQSHHHHPFNSYPSDSYAASTPSPTPLDSSFNY